MFSLSDGTLQPNPSSGSGVMHGTDCRKYLINSAVNTVLAMPTRPRRGRMLPSCMMFCQGRQEKMREGRENPAPCLVPALGDLRRGERRIGQGTLPLETMSSEQEGFTISHGEDK